MAASKGIRKRVSRTNKTQQRDNKKFDLSQENENDRTKVKHRNDNMPPSLGTYFTEVVGKVVAYINLFNNPPEWQGLEIHFTDGTLLHFEFSTAHTRIQPKYMEERHGESELIRDYGVMLTEEEKKVHRQDFGTAAHR